MSTNINNPWYLVGAAVVGIVGAAGMFIVEHYRQEKRRHVLSQDLARLDQQVSVMRRELEQLRALQRDNSKANKLRRSRPASVVSSAGDDYLSAADIDSSDVEFYDLSDDESIKTVTPLDKVLTEIDAKLDEGSLLEKSAVLEDIKDLCLDHPENPELLWRLAKAHHKLGDATQDVEEKKEHINKGIEACEKALKLNPDLSEAHKWFAILVGARSDFQPMKERILDGHLFKKHVDLALSFNPNDPSLHHMLGRFDYEIAGLKWYERKAASALYATPPSASYHDALEHFKEAEKLAEKDWKENKLFIAKCHLALGDYESAVSWLEGADKIRSKDGINNKIDTEVKSLLEKYNSYR